MTLEERIKKCQENGETKEVKLSDDNHPYCILSGVIPHVVCDYVGTPFIKSGIKYYPTCTLYKSLKDKK